MATHNARIHLIKNGTITASSNTTTGAVSLGVHGNPATLAWLPTQAGTVSLDFDYRVSYDAGTTWSQWKEITTAANTANEFTNTTALWNAFIVALVDAPLYDFRVEETGGANNVTDLELILVISEDV